MNEQVECHSGFTYAERPVAFQWDGRRHEVREIIEEWRIPGGHCFRVITGEQKAFELFYGELYDEWRINPV